MTNHESTLKHIDRLYQTALLQGANIDPRLPKEPQLGFIALQRGLLDTHDHISVPDISDDDWDALTRGNESQ